MHFDVWNSGCGKDGQFPGICGFPGKENINNRYLLIHSIFTMLCFFIARSSRKKETARPGPTGKAGGTQTARTGMPGGTGGAETARPETPDETGRLLLKRRV